MTTVIYHNPDCGTSRNVLAVIRATGTEPVVIPYLSAAADLTPQAALRTSKSPAEELGLLAPNVSDDAILDAMVAHPILVNRPIVCTPKGVALCRPSEAVLPLLEIPLTAPVYKEDGALILAP